MNFTSAIDQCSAEGTSLASIHSQIDNHKAAFLCIAGIPSNTDDSCWIGLEDYTNGEGNWRWTDGTITDFGFIANDSSRPDKGANSHYPWGGHHSPDGQTPAEDCVGIFPYQRSLITSQWHVWHDLECDESPFHPICNQKPNPVSQCLSNESEIHAWYDGSSIEMENKLWRDKSGNNNNGKIINGVGMEVFDGTNTSNSELYLNGQPTVTGTYQTQITFNIQLNPIHTVFNLAKYREGSMHKKRILQTDMNNGVFGFWNNRSGVAHEMDWVSWTNNLGEAWVLSSQQPRSYRGNGRDLTDQRPASVFDNTNKLMINWGFFGLEQSDFALSELIVFNEILNVEEIKCIENYIFSKYALPTFSPTKDPTIEPTSHPTSDPTQEPSKEPTVVPTTEPTNYPTIDPTQDPTKDPTSDPSKSPTIDPTTQPTRIPTIDPTTPPTVDPTMQPTTDQM